jgi:hypothetical protein
VFHFVVVLDQGNATKIESGHWIQCSALNIRLGSDWHWSHARFASLRSFSLTKTWRLSRGVDNDMFRFVNTQLGNTLASIGADGQGVAPLCTFSDDDEPANLRENTFSKLIEDDTRMPSSGHCSIGWFSSVL